MITEHRSSLFENSLLLKKCKTTEDVEKTYNVKVLGRPRKLNSGEMFIIHGEWDNVTKYEKDCATLLK